MQVIRIFALLLLLSLPATAFAVQGCGSGNCADCHRLSVAEASNLFRDVGEVKEVAVSRVKGLWEVKLHRDGRDGIAYLDYAKKNVLAGQVFPLDGEPPKAQKPAAAKNPEKIDFAAIPLNDAVVMGNPKGSRKLIVFTDPDCPFCRRFHEELKKAVADDRDLAVFVKLMPLRMHPQAYPKSRVIIASKSLELLEKAFTDQPLPEPTEKEPGKPVDDNIRLAESLGITGTPTSILPDGKLLVGAVTAEELRKKIDSAAGR